MAQNRGNGNEERGTMLSVYAAFTANLAIAISKFVAGFISGSAGGRGAFDGRYSQPGPPAGRPALGQEPSGPGSPLRLRSGSLLMIPYRRRQPLRAMT